MPTHDTQPQKTVLVTGGSGFLAGWIIIKLLQQGYDVRTTVRDVAQESAIRDTLVTAGAAEAADSHRLVFCQASLEHDAGWVEAADGCHYVIHTASPFPPVQPKREEEIIEPARDGTLRVLQASLIAGIPHVVMTTSSAAMEYAGPYSASTVITEASWTDIGRSDITPYTKSKTIAERAAWDFVAKHSNAITLTTIAPGTILGPVLGRHISFSVQSVKQLLDGSAPAIPRLGFGFVDVRDVADLHILAMTAAPAKNERFLAGGSFLWMRDVAEILRKDPVTSGVSMSMRTLPNAAARFLAIFTPSLRSIIHDLGKEHHYSPEKAQQLLGWSMRPIEDTVIDTAQSLYDKGVLSKKA